MSAILECFPQRILEGVDPEQAVVDPDGGEKSCHRQVGARAVAVHP